MGLGASHSGGGSVPSHRAEPSQRRRPSIRHAISSFLLCGASSSSSRVMEDCPAELVGNSAEVGDGERLKGKRKDSDLSLGTRAALADITKNGVSSGRCISGNEIPALQTVPGDVGYGDKGKILSESGKMISCQSMANSSNNGAASASCMVQPSPDCVSAAEIVNFDAAKDINSIISIDSSQIYEALSNSNHLSSHCSGESSLQDEVSAGNSIDSCSEDSSSYFPDSPIAFHIMHDDNLGGMMPSTRELILLEREQNRQERSLLQGDLMGVSSKVSLSNSVDVNVHALRTYRRSFSFSRNSVFSMDESDYSRSLDGSHHELSDDFYSNSLRGSSTSLGSGTHDGNELGWNSRSEFCERLRSSLDTTETPTDVCPRRIHAGSSCLCRSGSSVEESGSRAISRIVLLAQALFEKRFTVCFTVKIHRKENILECAEEISQCHICLAAYEEGDKIRVLPCQHEYHMSCVDKWLKDIHGVCPLCRGDVCKGVAEASCSNLDILPH